MTQNAYQLSQIRYCYGSKTALDLACLAIKAQQITALVGANGSGKSTLLNLLAFLSKANAESRLQFFDTEITPKQTNQYRKQVGFLPQKPYMLNGTVADNMQLALKLHGDHKKTWSAKIDQTLALLKISKIKHQQANTLSGGELQKAALARIIALEPKVLLLDEPFSYLDQNSALMMQKFISEYVKNTGNTLIFSTHNRLQGMALSQNIVSLLDGKFVETPLLNLFHGQVRAHFFDTGKLSIQLTDDIQQGHHISIDPREIVISQQSLHSSMRNHYQGRITAITEEKGHVRLTLDAGEIFHALITYQALKELNLHLGDKAWVNFKSNAVKVL